MPNRVQTNRSNVAGFRPTGRLPGELYSNWPDGQLGVITPSYSTQDLIAVRFFSALASYNIGDHVIQGGQLCRAIVAVSPGAFNAAQWVTLVTFAGGTYTGNIIVAPPTGNAILTLAKIGSPSSNSLIGQSASKNRWLVALGEGTAEGGSDAGSNFSIYNYHDDGTYIGNPLFISRASGIMSLSQVPTAPTAPVGDNSSKLATTNFVANNALLLTGGTMSGVLTTPGLAVSAVSNPTLGLYKSASGSTCQIVGYTGNVARWEMSFGDNTAEGSGSAGSNFAINRYDNSGNYLGTPMTITRSNGFATFAQNIAEQSNGVIYSKFSGNAIGFGWGSIIPNLIEAYVDGADEGSLVRSPVTGPPSQQPIPWLWGDPLNNTMNAIISPSTGIYWAYTLSDRRLKRDIKECSRDALVTINSLQVHDAIIDNVAPNADGKRGSTHWDFSLIADEVKSVLPEAVIEPEGNFASIRDLPLIAALVRAIQQLTEKVNSLNEQVGALGGAYGS